MTVTLGGHGYRTTIAPMGGAFWIPLAAEHREAAMRMWGTRQQAGTEAVNATIAWLLEPDADQLRLPLDEDARSFFDGLAPSHRKEWVRWVEEAKKPETRAARIEKTAEALRAGRKTR